MNKKRAAKKHTKRSKAEKQERMNGRITTILKLLHASSENPEVKEIDEAEAFFKQLHRRYDIPALKAMLARKIFTGPACRKVEKYLSDIKCGADSSNLSDSSDLDTTAYDEYDNSGSD